jgi:hypothetical protein
MPSRRRKCRDVRHPQLRSHLTGHLVADDLRYPIGPFTTPSEYPDELRRACIGEIVALPRLAATAVAGLDDRQLDTPYRPGGWTVRQVIHHLPDSHLNAYTRFRLALTEDGPVIRPYFEERWAELPDARDSPVAVSLALLEALHARWVTLLRALGPDAWSREFVHPEHGRRMTLNETLALYAWHGRHHVAHITRLRDREGWTDQPRNP